MKNFKYTQNIQNSPPYTFTSYFQNLMSNVSIHPIFSPLQLDPFISFMFVNFIHIIASIIISFSYNCYL